MAIRGPRGGASRGVRAEHPLRVRRVASAVGSASVAALVAACLVDIDYGKIPGPDADAGGDRAEPMTDAAASPADALVDAARAEARPRHCDGVDAAFCDDFDEGLLGARWSTVESVDASVELTSDASTSPPRSLLVAFDDAAGGEVRLSKGVLTRNLSRPRGSPVELSFDLRVVRFPPSPAYVQVAAIVFVDLAGVSIGVTGDHGSLIVLGPTPNVYDFPIKADTWIHLVSSADLEGGKVSLTVDGTPRVEAQPGLVRNDLGFVLAVGAAEREGTGGIRLLLDDVVLRSRR
jgi:hypothetical protein